MCTTPSIVSTSNSSFLVGQEDLLAQKTALQVAGKTQIVARLMVEEFAFCGIRNGEDVATCLDG